MKDLISNNAKFVLEYGQFISIGCILLCLYFIYQIGHGNKYLLPRTILGWLGSMVCIALIFILTLATLGLSQEKSTTGVVLSHFDSMIGKEAPKLTFRTVSTDSVNILDSYKGKVVLLNLWATWCSPCIREMPDLARLHNDFDHSDVVVLLLSDEARDHLLKFQKKKQYIPTLNYMYNEQIEWLNMDLGTARPLNLIIDRKGVIRDYYTGPRDYDFLASKVKTYL